MRKIRTWLICLTAVALIAAGANLPRFVAGVMDREIINQSGSRDMASIALDLSGERRSLSTAGKLALLRQGTFISVTENEATMTEAEVNAAVEEAMDEYIAAGIFDWFDYTAWTTQPKLCIDRNAPDNYGLFWTVTVINELEPYQTLMLDIDDETGKIYSIHYDCYGTYSLESVWERNAAVMDAFTHVYLNQLGLLDQENMEPYMEYGELDGEVLYGRFLLTDADHGEIAMEFYVTGTGSFWNFFPE